MQFDYDVTGKVSVINQTDDQGSKSTLEYKYDDRGFRMGKSHGGNNNGDLVYVRDASGSIMAIYQDNNGDLKPIEHPVYGASRLASYKYKDQSYEYDIKDHLGNVRGIIKPSDFSSDAESVEKHIYTYDFTSSDASTNPKFSKGQLSLALGYDGTKGYWTVSGGGVGSAEFAVKEGDKVSFSVYVQANINALPGKGGSVSQDYPAVVDVGFMDAGGTYHPIGGKAVSQAGWVLVDESSINFLPGEDLVMDGSGYFHLSIGVESEVACVCSADFDGINVEVSHTVPNTAKYATLTQILSRSYYPFGFPMADSQGGGSRFGYQGDFAEEDDETGFNHFEAREYDPVIGRWMVTDPAGQHFSPYLSMGNNPISSVDPNGGEDWYLNKKSGEIEWHNGSEEIEGYTHLGEDLTFSFSSYIDRADWDGPNPPLSDFTGYFDVSGEKVFNSVHLDFNQDEEGNLLGLATVSYESKIMTNAGGFKGVSWNSLGYYEIGAGGRGNAMSFRAGFEKHAGVPFVEALGLWSMGYSRVDVAQKLIITGNNGVINYQAFTDVFPSASLDVNGTYIMRYRQPSFKETHGFFSRPSPGLYPRQGSSYKRGGY